MRHSYVTVYVLSLENVINRPYHNVQTGSRDQAASYVLGTGTAVPFTFAFLHFTPLAHGCVKNMWQAIVTAHPASYPVGSGGPFPGGKARPGRDADHSPPSSAEVKNE
jgi:hypothetical protein